MKTPTHWAKFRSPDLDIYLKSRPVLMVPIGAIEVHGPHLPLDTDTQISEAVALAATRKLRGAGKSALVAPSFSYTVAEFGSAFAGTLSVPVSVFENYLESAMRSFCRHGVEQIVFVNSHLEPENRDVIRRVQTSLAASGINCVFPDIVRRRFAQRLGEEFMSGACHAGEYETSLMLTIDSTFVDETRTQELPDVDISLSEAIADGKKSFVALGGLDGYVGFPRRSSAEAGAEYLSTLVDIVVENISK